MSIGILIVTFNSARTIERCVRAVSGQLEGDDAIVVVDNGSSDETCSIIRAGFPGVRIIESANVGFGAGMNLARRYTDANWLLILNPDAFLQEHCLENLRAVTNTRIIYAPMQLDEAGQEKGAGRAADVFGFPVEARWFNKIFYADGAAIYISSALFDELGGFDETGFLFCEDLDISWRAWLRGHSVAPVPGAKIVHAGGESIAGGRNIGTKRVTSIARRYYTEFNTVRYLIQNYSAPVAIPVLFVYFALLSLEAAVLCVSGNTAPARELVRAVRDNVRLFPATLRAHRKVQATRKVSDMKILSRRFWGSGKALLFMEVGMPSFRR